MKQQRVKLPNLVYAGVGLLSLSSLIGAEKKTSASSLPTPPVYDWGTQGTLPPPGFVFPNLSPELPFDLGSLEKNADEIISSGTPGNELAILQKQFDIFSWRTFVALNWAADNDGKPMANIPIGSCNSATRVWEHYMAPRDFFKSDGLEPDPWGTPEHVSRTLRSTSKKTHILDEVDEAFFNLATPMPSITDLNNEYVRYEVRFNKPEYDYMYPFNTVEKQSAYIAKVAGTSKMGSEDSDPVFSFPMGMSSTSTTPGKMGAMELKVAWKKMGQNDDPSKFYTVEATIDDPSAPKGENGGHAIYGMVGMHIAVRTESAPQWVWATFEHVDNSPRVTLPLPDGQTCVVPEMVNGSPKEYSFWNSEGAGSISGFDASVYATLVTLGKKNAKLGKAGNFYQEKDDRSPSQIAQVVTKNNEVLAAEWTETLNATMQKKLAGTVWENYRLITTQWPSDPTAPTPVGYEVSLGKPAPVSIGNPVMETYLQVNGSCMGCHAGATLAEPNKTQFTNFSFMLQRAKSEKKTSNN